FTSVVAFFVSFSVTLSRSIGACTDKITSLSLHDALPILAFCPIPRCSRRSPAKRVRREEEEQGNERSFRRQAETEWSGLCDDERSEEHTSELQSRFGIVCRLLLERKK